jgi:hypothetical protein
MAQLLKLLSDPRVGDISLSKQTEPPPWALQAFGDLYRKSLKARTLHVMARDGVLYQGLDFDTLQELAGGLPRIFDAVRGWPEEAAIPPGS